MHPIFQVILLILQLYIYLIIAMVILSWLIGFNVINPHNQFVRQVRYALHQLTEPLLRPIRRFMPDLGGLDVSPVILMIGIFFLQQMIYYYGPQLL